MTTIHEADPYAGSEDHIQRVVLDLLTGTGTPTALDRDFGDNRSGRGAFILRALGRAIMKQQGRSASSAADILVLEAIRAGSDLIKTKGYRP